MAEPLNATFFAFRKREQSGVLLRLTVAFLIAAIALCAVFAVFFWASIGPFVEWYSTVISAAAANDTASVEAAGLPEGFFGFVGGMLLWMFPFYILCAAYEAGALRWMIHGEVKGFMGLSLGGATWRVWGCYWIWLLLNIAFSIVMSVLMGVIVGVATVGADGDSISALSALPIFYVFQYAVMIYFAVRLAPAAATSIARRKWAFFDAWTVTKGRFLSLLLSFFLLYVLYFIATIALAAAFFSIVLGAAAPDFASAVEDPARFNQVFADAVRAYLQSLSNPQNWIVIGALQLVGTVVGVVFYVAMYGVNARAAQVALEEGKITPAA